MKYEFQDCIGARVRKLSRKIDNYFRSRLVDFDITENQLTILFFLSKMNEIEQGVIGKHLSLEKSTVSRNVKLLENRNLVHRSSDYRPIVKLSKSGDAMVQELTPIWNDIMDSLYDSLGEPGIEGLKAVEKNIKL